MKTKKISLFFSFLVIASFLSGMFYYRYTSDDYYVRHFTSSTNNQKIISIDSIDKAYAFSMESEAFKKELKNMETKWLQRATDIEPIYVWDIYVTSEGEDHWVVRAEARNAKLYSCQIRFDKQGKVLKLGCP